MINKALQFRPFAEEVLADVGAGLHNVLLIFAIDDLIHAFDEAIVRVGSEERVPVAAPDDLEDIPAGAAEGGFEFLDDLAVATHRAVEPLQIAVDDEDEVVEPLARRKSDRAQRLGFVDLAIADEAPNMLFRGVLESAVVQIAIEARLVDGRERPEPHRHRGEFPEVRHQPGMRVCRHTLARRNFTAKVAELLLTEPAFEKRAGVDTGRRVSLKVDEVAARGMVLATEEVVEADLVQRGGGRERRDMAANAGMFAVGADDHGQRVPADDTLEASFDLAAARVAWLLIRGNRVQVRSVGAEG